MSPQRFMRTRIAKIPYLNSAPFYHRLEGSAFGLRTMPPRPMGEAARRREVDAGPFSLLDYLALQSEFEPVGDFIIGVKKSAGSVIVFSQAPLQFLTASSVVELSPESTTAAVLAKVILKERFKVVPRFVTDEAEGPDARLLIGDAALAASFTGLAGYPHQLDLGQAWWDWHRLPFVFAVWAIRRGMPSSEVNALKQMLGDAIKAWDEELDLEQRYRSWRARLGLSYEQLRQYTDGFVYRKGADEAEAIEIFQLCIKRLEGSDVVAQPAG